MFNEIVLTGLPVMDKIINVCSKSCYDFRKKIISPHESELAGRCPEFADS
jgi:hypothetical protein